MLKKSYGRHVINIIEVMKRGHRPKIKSTNPFTQSKRIHRFRRKNARRMSYRAAAKSMQEGERERQKVKRTRPLFWMDPPSTAPMALLIDLIWGGIRVITKGNASKHRYMSTCDQKS